MYPDGVYVINIQNNQVVGNPVDYQSFSSANPVAQNLSYLEVGGIAICILLVIMFVKGAVFMVRQQNVKIVERLGKFKKIAKAGLNFKIPILDRIVANMELRVIELAEEVTVKSSDSAFLTIPVKIQSSVLPDKAEDAYYKLSESEKQIRSYITNTIRSKAAGMSMEEIFKDRSELERSVSEGLKEKFSGFGYEISNVLIDNPLPSQEVQDAFNRVIASQRIKDAAMNEAEAVKIRKVGEAEGEAAALTIKAKAYVEQRETMAKFFEHIPETVRQTLIGIDYRDMVRDASEKGAMVIVPSNEAGNDMGSLIAAVQAAKKAGAPEYTA